MKSRRDIVRIKIKIKNVLAAFMAAVMVLTFAACVGDTKYPVPKSKDGEFRFALTEVGHGRAHFYSYRHDGVNIDFFVRKDSGGKYTAYFDACFVCYRYKKGYIVEGSDLVCVECKKHFPIPDKEWEDIVGCAPIDLIGEVRGDVFVVMVDDVIRGEVLFK
jgi:uncharacterized membrane protein